MIYKRICCLLFCVFSNDGAGQQCCYDIDGYLMMTSDSMWGGNPHRAHNLGMMAEQRRS